MAGLREVPVVEVHTENIKEIWPSLVLAIRSSTFVAIDTELSGLGDRKQLFAKSIDDRYKGICEVAKSRSIIALGISCFKLRPPEVSNGRADDRETAVRNADTEKRKGRNVSINFVAQTFNIFVLCSENYVVEPLSLKFLIDHGFDFNRQYSKGLPYRSGNYLEQDKTFQHLRQLFVEIALAQTPIVLHNALVDLIFLYQCFYTSLPASLASFVTDLSQIFVSGIYDTKYIVEFKARMQASFLEYAFRKCQRDNCSQSFHGLPCAEVSFLQYGDAMQEHIAVLSCGLRDQPCSRDVGKTTLCQNFAGHGWCTAGYKCPNSHDVDMILDSEDWSLKKNRRKHSAKNAKETAPNETADDSSSSSKEQNLSYGLGNETTSDKNDSVTSMQLTEVSSHDSGDSCPVKMPLTANRSGGHRAGFDAFMTGYIFASLIAKHGIVAEGITECTTLGDFGLVNELCNKVYLGGKDFPLQIASSSFAKPSKLHVEKWQRIKCSCTE